MINLKKLFVAGSILALVLIIIFISAFIKSKNDQDKLASSQINSQSHINWSPTAAQLKPQDKQSQYINNKYRFSFILPAVNPLEIIEQSISVPNGKNRINLNSETAYQHKIFIEYCSLKGECQPTTTDMMFGVAVLDQNTDKYAHSNPSLKRAPINSKTYTYSYSEGAEGEGINYYFIPLNQNETAIFFHKYINESVMKKFKNQADFIPYSRQKELISSLLQSFKIQN